MAIFQLHEKPKGRPKIISPRTLKLLKRQVEKQPSITAVQLKKNNPYVLKRTSTNTVWRPLRINLEYRRLFAKRKLLIIERQQSNRIKFAKDILKWYKNKWTRCLFTYETTFNVMGI